MGEVGRAAVRSVGARPIDGARRGRFGIVLQPRRNVCPRGTSLSPVSLYPRGGVQNAIHIVELYRRRSKAHCITPAKDQSRVHVLMICFFPTLIGREIVGGIRVWHSSTVRNVRTGIDAGRRTASGRSARLWTGASIAAMSAHRRVIIGVHGSLVATMSTITATRHGVDAAFTGRVKAVGRCGVRAARSCRRLAWTGSITLSRLSDAKFLVMRFEPPSSR